MNTISHSTTTESVTTIIEKRRRATATFWRRTVHGDQDHTAHCGPATKRQTEMAAEYGFGERQLEHLDALLGGRHLRNVGRLCSTACTVQTTRSCRLALTQVGNVGGEPYWSMVWLRQPCGMVCLLCFLVAPYQCGYIDTGVIPKFAGCVNGVQWFRDRGQWADNAHRACARHDYLLRLGQQGSLRPAGRAVRPRGIVWKVEDGIIYTVEGNSGDSCRVNQYPGGITMRFWGTVWWPINSVRLVIKLLSCII